MNLFRVLPLLFPLMLSTLSRALTPDQSACTFNPAHLTRDESYAVEALQGLANRHSAALFITGHPGDERWLALYTADRHFHFDAIPDLPGVLQKYKTLLKGVVAYDAKIDGTRCVALTLAGVEDLLPVDSEMLDSAAVKSLHLPLITDLRGKFTTSVAAYAWAIQNVLPRCNRSYAHTPSGPDVDGLHVGMGPFAGFDFTVAHQGFIFNLTLVYQNTDSFGTTVAGDKRQADLYREILGKLQQPALVLGYGEFEWNWFNLLGENGHSWLHWGSNLSFHERVPVTERPQQKSASRAADPAKFQVCFITSEGDTMKGLETFFYDSWSDPARGSVAINWAIPPESCRFPAMLDTYYRSATANDCFIAYDIVNLPQMPNLVSFAAHRAEQMHTADLRIMALSSKDLGSPNLPIYLKALHPDGAAGIEWQGKSEASTSFVDTIPYVTSAKKLSYWQGQIFGWRTNWTELLSTSAGRDDAIEKLVAAIEKVAGDHKPPFVILVYADIHNYSRLCELAASVAAKLDPARLEVSRLDAALRTLKSP